MTQVVFKYPLDSKTHLHGKTGQALYEVVMPEGAKVISAGLRGEPVPCIWALIDTREETMVCHHFLAVWTGVPFPELPYDDGQPEYEFIATFRVSDQIFHIFEVV
jgi:hypothetical protein